MENRFTDLGYPVVGQEIYDKVFGTEKPRKMTKEDLEKAKYLLGGFDIQTPVSYPENLYTGPLPLPPLKGSNLREHFENIAKDQVGRYRDLGDEFSKCILPQTPPPEEFLFQSGWTRYEKAETGWLKEKVQYPKEEAFTFDTETFVHNGAFPIIGTALSAKAAYIWLAAELIDPTTPEDEWDQYGMIPVGTDRFIAGHNISYDRIRASEGYSFEHTKPENFYFDTLSAHIGVSGLASGQRWLYILAGKNPEDLTDEEKTKLRYAPKC